MKFFVVFAFCVAAATARFVIPDLTAQEAAEIQQIKDMINHPNTDPATATALQQLLDELLGVKPQEDGEEISVDPVIVEEEYEPISVGPAIIDPVVPSPSASPLVQIIINVNSGAADPVVVDAPVVEPSEVDIIDSTPIVVGPGFEPVDVDESAPVIVGPGFETVDVDESAPVIVGPGFETVDVEESAPIVVGPGFEPVDVDESAPVVVGPGFETVEEVPEIDPSPVIVVDKPEVPESIVVAPVVTP